MFRPSVRTAALACVLTYVSPSFAQSELRSDNYGPCTPPVGYIQNGRFIVGDDPGGCAVTYHRAMRAYAQRGIAPVITGAAQSAATQWAAMPGACAVPGASLVFHGLEARLGWTPAYREDFIRKHPPALQTWLRSTRVLDGPESYVLSITTPELYRYIPPCAQQQVQQQQQLNDLTAARTVLPLPRPHR